MFDVAIVQPGLFWNFAKGWGIGPALAYNSTAGLRQKLSLLFVRRLDN